MDRLDLKILSELQNKGYQKSSLLAQQFGVGSRTINRRIAKMKEEGSIQIIAIPNPIIAGHRAWAKVGILAEPRSLGNIAYKLVKHPAIYFVAYTAGKFDMEIVVQLDDLDSLSKLVNLEIASYKGVLSTETIIMVWPVKFYNFFWPIQYYIKNAGKRGNDANYNGYNIDEIDRKILYILNRDAFTSIKEIKSKLDIGESAIRSRIRIMDKHNVFKTVVLPGPKVLESEIWVSIGLITDGVLIEEIIDKIIENDSVYFVSLALGRRNLLVAARFGDMENYERFVNQELGKIKGIINIEKYIYTKLLKYYTYDLINTKGKESL